MLDLPLNATTLLVATLAAWQFTGLLHYDRGPFRMLIHFRTWMSRIGLRRLVQCFYCMSVWASAAVVITLFTISWLTPVLCFAVGGAVALMELRLGWAKTGRGVAGSSHLPVPASPEGDSAAAA